MENTKYQRLVFDCHEALKGDNVEKCVELLSDSLDERTQFYDQYIQLCARFNSLLQLWHGGQTPISEYLVTRSQILNGFIHLLKILRPEDVSLLRRIHEKILIVACKNSNTKWEKIFSEAFFSHVFIIVYKEDVPDVFKSSDVIIFDDLDCNVKGHSHFKKYIDEMPNAHILYVGYENPLKEDNPNAFKRCANANSEITILARLRELLEFRKVYGLPEA